MNHARQIILNFLPRVLLLPLLGLRSLLSDFLHNAPRHDVETLFGGGIVRLKRSFAPRLLRTGRLGEFCHRVRRSVLPER